jgi:PRC-barrel domain
MVDRDGNRLGEITDIYLDRETDRPEWAVVRTGLFGLRSSFVPLAETSEVDDQIQVPHARALVKDAPNIEADGQLSEAEEAELYRHYGLDYDSVAVDGGQVASQSGGPADQDQPTAPAATDEAGRCPDRGTGGAAQQRRGAAGDWRRGVGPAGQRRGVGGRGGGEPAVCV